MHIDQDTAYRLITGIVAISFCLACFGTWCEHHYWLTVASINRREVFDEINALPVTMNSQDGARPATPEERQFFVLCVVEQEIERRALEYLCYTYVGFHWLWRICAFLGYPFIILFRYLYLGWLKFRDFTDSFFGPPPAR